jgi:hypothetical protein
LGIDTSVSGMNFVISVTLLDQGGTAIFLSTVILGPLVAGYKPYSYEKALYSVLL